MVVTIVKVEYHANVKYENPLTISENNSMGCQRIMDPIMKKKIFPH